MSGVETVADGGAVIALIVQRSAGQEPGAAFFTDPSAPQQVARLTFARGHVVAPHRHRRRALLLTRTTEVLVIEEGKARIDLFARDGRALATRVLQAGDLAVLLDGGHGLTMLERTVILEIKQGPYRGREFDKETL